MKKILSVMIMTFVLFLNVGVSAEYNPDKQTDNYNINTKSITTTNATSDMLMCTMEYMPVCGYNGETYGNQCMAGDNEIAHSGECSEYVNYNMYKKLEVHTYKLSEKIEDQNTNILINALEKSNTIIDTIKKTRVSMWLQKERITRYTFLNDLIMNELDKRG